MLKNADYQFVYKHIEMLFNDNGELFIYAAEYDVHTYSYDEKTGIQTISTTGKDSIQPRIVEQLSAIMSINVLVWFPC